MFGDTMMEFFGSDILFIAKSVREDQYHDS
jgi:hypothetical protein